MGVRRRFKRNGTYIYLWLIHFVVWQKPIQNCKAIILQLKMKIFWKVGSTSKVGSQDIPGITGKFCLGVQVKAYRVLPRERTGHSKHPLPTTQEKTLHMDITRWSILKSDCLYSLQLYSKLYTVSKNKTGSWLWLRSWTPYCQIQT